jgi:hypothetical protein
MRRAPKLWILYIWDERGGGIKKNGGPLFLGVKGSVCVCVCSGKKLNKKKVMAESTFGWLEAAEEEEEEEVVVVVVMDE